MEANSQNFEQNGFAVFKSVLTPEEVKTFRGEIEIFINKPKDELQGDTNNVKSNIFLRSESITRIFLQEKIMNVIKEVCGDNFCILPEISVMKSQYGRWHKDTTSIELFGQDFHKKDDFRVVNVAIYCQDNGEYGGGLDIVPGSHKSDDPFVHYYKEQGMGKQTIETKKAKELGLLKETYLGIKAIIRNSLLKAGLLPKVYKNRMKTEGLSYELASSDTMENKYTIPSKAGDIIIFDLRMSHKASWPTKVFDPKSAPLKFAFFAICGVNNNTTYDYRQYLNKRAETQDAYFYLRNYNLSPMLMNFGEKNGINIL